MDTDGIRYSVPRQLTDLGYYDVRRLVPRILIHIGFDAFADIGEVDVSTKPPTWTGEKKEEILLVKGARLEYRDLRYAEAFRAFLVNANLVEADLRGASLYAADLRNSKLVGANLQNAWLQRANLEGADLLRANFSGALLMNVKLKGANLGLANLQGAYIFMAEGLEKNQLEGAANWALAFYSKDLLKILGLPTDHNKRVRGKDLSQAKLQEAVLYSADLQKTNLSKANLQGAMLASANLTEADLRGADLRRAILDQAGLHRANLERADLRGADLTDTTGLTKEQIKSAIIDKNTRLPEYLKEGVKVKPRAQ